MAESARAPLGRDKAARSLEPLTGDAADLSAAVLHNTASLKDQSAFPKAPLAALDNSTAGVKARLSGVPVTPRELFARAAAAVRPAGE
jgi:hypothetical protein